MENRIDEQQKKEIVALIEEARWNPDDCNPEGLAEVINDILNPRKMGMVLTGKARDVFDHISAIASRFPDMPVKLWIEQGV